MAIYLVSGKLGAGKTLSSVGRIRDKLLAGCRVVTNLDLKLDAMLPARAGSPDHAIKPDVIRIPDKPEVQDLELIGLGNPSMDESKNGLIVLDELAAWLNARSWADKSRQAVIDWLIHSRKKGWDVMFICQHIDQIDKQIRTALVEFLVVCRRMDRMRIPFVGGLLKTLSGGLISGNLPRVHLAVVRYGTQPDAIVSDRWIFKGEDLYDAYDTRQVFVDRDHPTACGPYSCLTPWHTKGRYMPPPVPLWRHALNAIGELIAPPSPDIPRPEPKPKHPLIELIMRLPEEQRLKHFRRLEALGAF